MHHIPHAQRPGIRQHDKPQVARRLVVVQLVLGRSVANKRVVLPAQLAHHVAQREHGAEDQLGVVRRLVGCADRRAAAAERVWVRMTIMRVGVDGRARGAYHC